jgi:hypothetical protein
MLKTLYMIHYSDRKITNIASLLSLESVPEHFSCSAKVEKGEAIAVTGREGP